MSFRRRKQESNVPPLMCCIKRTVRLEEVDPLNIMWHGRYASWLEDGREALGKAYGIHYLDFFAQGVVAPLKIFHVDYQRPLHYGETYTVETSLLWNDAALLETEYRILDATGAVMTTAVTTQLLLNHAQELLLEHPPFFQAIREKWQAGTLLGKNTAVEEKACL